MKGEDIFFIGGLVFIGYWLTKKQPNIISVDPIEKSNITDVPSQPKTITLDLNPPKPRRANSYIDSSVVKSYDASKFSTVAPPMVTIQREY
jgi:hypothetical protein